MFQNVKHFGVFYLDFVSPTFANRGSYGIISIAMINVNHVSYEVGNRNVLDDVSLSINDGDRTGLVGANGAGKTTLLKLINGDIKPTSGEVVKGDCEVGMLPQDLRAWSDHSVYDFIEEATGVKGARERFDANCARLSTDTSEESLNEYANSLEKYEKYDVSSFDANLNKALRQASIPLIDTSRNIGSFSGGQRTRIALAAILASQYDVMLLDEPTNSLDESGVETLQDFIKNSNKSFLMVSHDRRFLRQSTNRILELNSGVKGIKQYNLGYDEYVEARQHALDAMAIRYEQYEKEKKRLNRAAKEARIKANSAGGNKRVSDSDKLNAKFCKEKASVNLAKGAAGINARLEQLEAPEVPLSDATVKLSIDRKGDKKISLLSVEDLTVNFDDGRTIGPVSMVVGVGDRVMLRGENGVGKSTIMKAIFGRINSTGQIWLNNDASAVYIDQDQTLPLPNESPINNLLHIAPGMELHDAINLLLRMGIDKGAIYNNAGVLSGGERMKVLLAGASATGANLLAMDEPTNNLDIPSIESLEKTLKNYSGGILFVSHDRDFVDSVSPTQVIDLK